jgi:hypothetical protein
VPANSMGITAPRRTLVAALALLAVLAMVSPGAARAQRADAEAAFSSRIAHERGAHGLVTLAAAGDLAEIARRHAQRMADRGEPYHNPSLGSEVQGWEIVGENVGVGYDVEALHRAFMDSSSHRANILHREVTELGAGVVTSADGRIWVVQVFRRPTAAAAGSAGPAPAPGGPAPAPEPSPAPVPGPAPPAPSIDRAVAVESVTAPPPAADPADPAAPVAGFGERDHEAAVAAVATPAEIEVQGVSLRPAPQAPGAPPGTELAVGPLARPAAQVPAPAWVAALALVAAVAVQGAGLCRLGLVDPIRP